MKRHAGAGQLTRPGTTEHPQTSDPQTAGNAAPPPDTSPHTHTVSPDAVFGLQELPDLTLQYFDNRTFEPFISTR
ncbi:hypothetical protein INR49_013980 [Caranx melampygus]|nr:hypothetical protein INR49_013980 [Caranx melampygus]